ncbi:hypothetical protein ACVWYG_003754 [Pedobacter sp. UYEF25]
MDKSISRIDRAVADNLRDIERSFEGHSGLVQDFIVFITKQIKFDLFGYTKFTLAEFCRETGRNRQDLSIKHPMFKNAKVNPPIIEGFKFETVFDYTLYIMLERNLIFSNKYEYRKNEEIIQLKGFSILIDLRLNFNRTSKELKCYEVKVSNELLDGFFRRYYTINTEIYRRVGKGRGGETRQSLLLYLFKINHILFTSSDRENSVVVPLDRLCEYANIRDQKPAHKKQNLNRILGKIKESSFDFNYEFVNENKRYQYIVKLSFNHLIGPKDLMIEHSFFAKLVTTLKYLFKAKYVEGYSEQDPVPFQNWLGNNGYHLQEKASILVDCYSNCLDVKITRSFATELILSGDILSAKDKV